MEPSLLFTGTVIIAGCLLSFYLAYVFLMFYFSRRPSNIRKSKIFPFVSLVVATFNEENTIQQKLQNIEELDYPKNQLEVIVVDGASTDRTCEIVNEFIEKGKPLNIRLLKQQERSGKATALNYAFAQCKGEIIVISDADCSLERDALTTIISNFSDTRVGAVTGRQVLLNGTQSLATRIERSYRSFYEVIRIGESNLDSTTIFHGELSAFRANLTEQLYSTTICDDIEMACRIRRKGYKTIYDKDAVFYEFAPPTIRARFLQKTNRGQGVIQALLRFPNMLFHPKFGFYGFVILPSELMMHVVSPIALSVTLGLACVATGYAVPYLGLREFLIATLIVAIVGTLSEFVGQIKNLIITTYSFLSSQVSLLLSLIFFALKKKNYKWKQVEEIRSLWKYETAKHQFDGASTD